MMNHALTWIWLLGLPCVLCKLLFWSNANSLRCSFPPQQVQIPMGIFHHSLLENGVKTERDAFVAEMHGQFEYLELNL